jgi:hypothetical protein
VARSSTKKAAVIKPRFHRDPNGSGRQQAKERRFETADLLRRRLKTAAPCLQPAAFFEIGERMEIETRPERAEHLDVAEPVDVDPGDALVIEMRQEFSRVGDGAFFKMRGRTRSG